MTEKKTTSRRDFIKGSMATAVGLTALSAPTIKPVLGANDKIRMGFIGVGNRGSQLLERFVANKDVELVAICDVYEPYAQRDYSKVDARVIKGAGGRVPKMGEKLGKYDIYSDFRRVLERKDIDAVCIGTPDHWHAVQTIMACEAGKDVYCEKPLTIALREGRRMVDAQKRTNRVVQVGLNRRGSTLYQEMVKLVQGGKIGTISTARASRISNMAPNGIGREKPSTPPKTLDWDMWLGPRAYQPYQDNIAPYKFRWWKAYSSQMGNWGVHYFDVMRWMLGERAPKAVTAIGINSPLVDDDRTIPDTCEVIFEFESGLMMTFSIYEAGGGRVIQIGEVELRGTKGNLYTTDNNYTIVPSRPGQFQDWDQLVDDVNKDIEREDITAKLIRNFLDCVKTRKEPWCPLEEGHRSTSFAHIANISLEMGTRLEWDADKEEFTNNKYANNLLDYEYRAPWKK